MKKNLSIAVFFIFSIFLLITCTSCSAFIADDTKLSAAQMLSKQPAPLEVELPNPSRWTLDNGIQVVFLEDKELPLIDVSLIMRSGRYWQPDVRPAALPALGYVMRTGGAGEYSSDELERKITELGASFSVNFGNEQSSISFSGLSADISDLFKLSRMMLLEPRLDKDKLALWKAQNLENIRRRKDNPFTVASTSFRQLLLGEEFYGTVLESRHLTEIDVDYLQSLLGKHIRPEGAYLVVTGSAEEESLRRLTEQYFGNWAPEPQTIALSYPPMRHQHKPSIVFVPGDYAQASVIAGTLGPQRLPPDYAAIDLLNEIVGTGGFSSRLMRRVREELGLAYWIGGSVSADNPFGITNVALQTSGQQVGDALKEVFMIIRDIQQNGPSKEEMSLAQSSLSQSFVFRFDSPAKIAHRIVNLELKDYPPDFDEDYVGNILDVEQSQIKEAAQKYFITPNQLLYVVVGPEKTWELLEQFVADNSEIFSGIELQRGVFNEKLSLAPIIDE